MPAELRLRLERACDGPIQALLPDAPVPSLTHGDLWPGNMIDGRWLVDPAVPVTRVRDRLLQVVQQVLQVADRLG